MDFTPVTDYIKNVLRKEKGVPGCDVLIRREHEPLLRYMSGVSDYEGNTPIRGDELYYMYSCTKPITCTAAMQLVEQGKLRLDAPVYEYLPAYKHAFLMKDGQKVSTAKPMTVRQLFTMSAGLDYDRNTAPLQALAARNPKAGTVEVVNAFIECPLQFEPGSQFLYSLCHDVLAAVVEVVSGQRFGEYLKKNIFEPLNMKHTGFFLSKEEENHLVAQYACSKPDSIQPFQGNGDFRITENYESGGAGLYSCVEDYSLFADAMANGGVGATGARILKSESIDLMRTEQLSTYAMNPQFGCAAGPGYGYGLGVRTLIDKSGGQRSSLGEFGWDGAAGSYVMIDPAQRLSIFFAMHVRGWPNLIGCGHAPIRDLTYEVLGL